MNKKLQIPLWVWKTMKISSLQLALLVIFCGIAHAHKTTGQNVLDRRISIQAENLRLMKVLSLIEEQANVRFIYSSSAIDIRQKITLSATNKKLENVLKDFLFMLSVDFTVADDRILLKRAAPQSSGMNAREPDVSVLQEQEDRTVTGKVTDGGEPLTGVSILVKGTQRGVITDSEGNYTIKAEPEQTLIFSFIGYKTVEQVVGNQSKINLTLQQDAAILEEAVVIGYGTQSRSTLTTSIAKLDKKVLESVPLSNVGDALQGTVPGVTVQRSSGQPGSNPTIIVRGGTSINNPNGAVPLFIIDGVIKPNLGDINQDEIESMQVLKDAASTSIYGARGSNGVVLVTTKGGKSGKSRIVYSVDRTISRSGKYYEFLSGRDWIYFMRTGIQALAPKNPAYLGSLSQATGWGTGNDLTKNTFFTTQYLTNENKYKLDEGWKSMPDPLDPSKTIIYDEYDYRDVLFRTAVTDNHSLSVSGGNEKAKFSSVIGYQNAQGIAVYTNYRRYSANLFGELQVNKNLSFFSRLMYSNSSTLNTPSGLEVAFRRIGAPTSKLYFEDGTISQGAMLSIGANPDYPAQINDVKQGTDNTTIIVGANYEILPGLTFQPQFSLFMRHVNNRSFRKSYYEGSLLNVNRNASSGFSKLTQPQLDAVFSYSKSIGKHNFDAQAGFSYFYQNLMSISASGNNAATDLIPTLNASGSPVSVGGTETEQLLLGYFGRVNYNFDRKYLLSVTARYDGASNLGANYKWGAFPGVSLGWNVHEETFFKDSRFTDLISLKLRGSYGVNGNISGIGLYAAQGTYATGPSYNTQASINNTVLANQALKWERSNTLNFGLDFGLFNQRVNVIFDMYRRVTNDLLASMTLPPSSGFSSITTNLASLENKGLELEINANIMPATSPFQWNISANASSVRNKILKLPNNGVEKNRIGGVYVWDAAIGDYAWKGGLQEGGKMGDYYVYKQLGVYRTDEEAQAGPKDMLVTGTNKTKYGGDVNWLDADGNNIIDNRDMVYGGNQYPKFSGGFTNTFTYKNLNLYIRSDYTLGHTIYSEGRMWLIGQATGVSQMTTDLLRSWQKQGDETDIPRYYFNDQAQANVFRGSSLFYEKGDYLAIREVTLSYNLPAKIFRNKIDGLSIHFSGHNLHYFTKYNGPSPEAGGTDDFRYPMPRNFVIGLKIRL